MCSAIGDIGCEPGEDCFVTSGGSIECVNVCVIYNNVTNPQCENPDTPHSIIFPEGKCEEDDRANPFCEYVHIKYFINGY